MDKQSYEKRKEDDQRRFVRFTLQGGLSVYVDRCAIRAFWEDAEGKAYLNIDGVVNNVQESISEIMIALGMRGVH